MKQNDILSYFRPLTDQAPKIGIFPAAAAGFNCPQIGQRGALRPPAAA